jgi:hypothetical protein
VSGGIGPFFLSRIYVKPVEIFHEDDSPPFLLYGCSVIHILIQNCKYLLEGIFLALHTLVFGIYCNMVAYRSTFPPSLTPTPPRSWSTTGGFS